MKDLGELKYFLGIEFARSKEGILMHQRKYVLELISEVDLGAAKPAMTPMDANIKLTSKEYDDHVIKAQAEPMANQGAYQKLIAPKQSHMEAAIRIVRYLKKEPGQGVLLSSNDNIEISAYCDADWVACPNSRKSVTGYVVKLRDSPIIWKSKKHTTVSKSSAEAEYRSLASTVAELVWIIGLMKELGVDVTLPVKVYSDSKAAMQIAANPVYHERTKHIEIDCHFIREKIMQGVISTSYIPTNEQPADLLTKSLFRMQHEVLSSKLAMDLSWNWLTGNIPTELTRLKFLAVLNLSQNVLVGPIPQGLQFDTFGNDSYGGNLDLCGLSLSKQCGTSGSSHVPQPSESYFFSGFTWESVVIGYSCGLVVGTVVWSLMFKYRKPKWFVEFFDGLMPHKRRRPN
ncbi:hypothetical protein KY289_012032 [Solanum tuberosum]|nr:hypothetical protein KY289_012032 [Solanum tuberosum]